MYDVLTTNQLSLSRVDDGEAGKMYYAVSDSTDSQPMKVISTNESVVNKIQNGFSISVTFDNPNVAKLPSLSIEDGSGETIGPSPIITNGMNEAYWDAGSTVIFTYNDGYWYTSSTPVYGSNAVIGNLADRYIKINPDSIDIMKAGDEEPIASFGEETTIRTDGAVTKLSNGMSIEDEVGRTYFDVHKVFRGDIDYADSISDVNILRPDSHAPMDEYVFMLDHIYTKIKSIELVYDDGYVYKTEYPDDSQFLYEGFERRIPMVTDYPDVYGILFFVMTGGSNELTIEVTRQMLYRLEEINIVGHCYDKASLTMEGDVDIFGGTTSINGYTDFEDFTDAVPSDAFGSRVTLRTGIRQFRTVNLTFLIKTTSSVSSGSNIASGTINSRMFPYLPVSNVTGSGYYGDNPIIMQLRNDGSWTVRNAGADSVTLTEGSVVSLTYIIDNGYGGGSSSGGIITPTAGVSEEKVKDIVLSYDYISRDEASENYVKIEEDIEEEEIEALFYLLFD